MMNDNNFYDINSLDTLQVLKTQLENTQDHNHETYFVVNCQAVASGNALILNLIISLNVL